MQSPVSNLNGHGYIVYLNESGIIIPGKDGYAQN